MSLDPQLLAIFPKATRQQQLRILQAPSVSLHLLATLTGAKMHPYYNEHFAYEPLFVVPIPDVERLGQPVIGETYLKVLTDMGSPINGMFNGYLEKVTDHDSGDRVWYVEVRSPNTLKVYRGRIESAELSAYQKPEPFFNLIGSTPHDDGSCNPPSQNTTCAVMYHTNLPMEKAIERLAKPYKSVSKADLQNGYALFVVYDNRE